MIRIIFDNGELLDCKNVDRIIFDKEELVKEVTLFRYEQNDTYVMELRGVTNERLSDLGSGEA